MRGDIAQRLLDGAVDERFVALVEVDGVVELQRCRDSVRLERCEQVKQRAMQTLTMQAGRVQLDEQAPELADRVTHVRARLVDRGA